MTQTATAPAITFGTPVIVNGTDYRGTVTKVRNAGLLFGVELEGRTGVVFYGASELTVDDAAVAKAAKAAASFARQEAGLAEQIAELNALLGLTEAEHKVSFGYIGNGKMTASGWDLSDARWSVFLPHPGRVGQAEDRVGSFRTGSLEGIVATRRALAALTQGVRLARSI